MPVAKTEITLPGGAKVTVEGAPDEVQEITKVLGERVVRPGGTRRDPAKNRAEKAKRTGPSDRVRDLIEEGFFKTKRSIADIQKRLSEKGHIYDQEGLSPVLIRLTRSSELRRVGQRGVWQYVNP